MDARLAARRTYSDGNILDGTAESAHGMSFEVRQNNGEVVVQEIAAYEVGLQVPAVPDRKFRFAFAVHDVHVGDGREAV